MDPDFTIDARLDSFVRGLRTRRGWTRVRAAKEANVGLATYRKIERGETAGYGEVALEGIADSLCDNEHERAHLWALAGRPEFSAMQRVVSAVGSIQKIMRQFDPYPAGWMTEGWRIELANDRFRELYPGMIDAPSVPEWVFFDPRARLVSPDWWREVESLVGVCRHLLTDPGTRDQVLPILEALRPSPIFRQVWASGIVYTQRPSPLRRIWSPAQETTLLYEEFLLPTMAGGVLILTIPADETEVTELDWGLRRY
ncbi:MmyB family transcriptional regulator [Nocardia sp. NPDC004722]